MTTKTAAGHRVRLAVAGCSGLFAVGSALQNFVIVNEELVAAMMGGTTEAASEFTFWFRVVGCVYILGNALGLLALRSRSRLLWWAVLAVNATQALGFVMIPPSMWSAAADAHGFWGLLPSAITDGGAILLVVAMIVVMVRHGGPWGGREPYRP